MVSCYEPASPSPTPFQNNDNLAQFPVSPPDSEVVHHQIIEDMALPPDQINGTAALCQAILHYQQSYLELLEFMEACMGDLMISIMAMSDTDTTCPLSITNGKYNCIAHLTYISAFIDKIEPYLKDAVREVGPPPTLLQHIITPSHISVTDSKEENTDHPGRD